MSTKKTEVTAYKKLSDIEHVLIRPGMYAGSIVPLTEESWRVDQTANKMVMEELTWNPAFLKLFDEIISNAVDESRRPSSKLDTIKVMLNRDSGEITVEDNGGIIVELQPEYGEYVPSMIFGHLRAGSNFDDDVDDEVAGQNGIGATLTNIFSERFTVETCDTKRRFKQTWTNNMQTASPVTVLDMGGRGATKITYLPDYKRFGLTGLDDGNYHKLVKRVYDVAGCNPKLKLFLNGEPIVIKSFSDYVSLYQPEHVLDENDSWQVAIAKPWANKGFTHVSFVNTVETNQGGTHVDYVSGKITGKLRDFIKKKHKIDVKPANILQHFQVYINARVVRPRFNSQTKENLKTAPGDYKTSWEPTDKFIQAIIKSGIVQAILDWAELKAQQELKARMRELNKETSKGDPRRVANFSDALEDKQRELCELFLTEGNCLSEKTKLKVVAANGSVQTVMAGEVRVGDLVITHRNRYKAVTAISYSVKELVTINTPAGPLLVSSEHRLLAYDGTEFGWVAAKDLDPSRHQLVRSTLMDVVHAPIVDVSQDGEMVLIEYDLAGKVENYESTKSHKFSVFDIEDLSYKMVRADELVVNRHVFTFRYKYDVYNGRHHDSQDEIHYQRV